MLDASPGILLRRCAPLVACLAMLIAAPARAQVLQLWSHQAAFGDASAAVAMNDTLMFVCDNEDEKLGLYSRVPGAACVPAIYTYNARPFLNPTGSDSSADLESAVKLSDANGTRIYWLGSLGNSKTGALRPNRDRILATQVLATGGVPPFYTLSYVGRYDQLREDIIAWDVNNRHGLGANYFGLAASAAHNVSPNQIDGFNIEGLAMAPDGVSAYIAFRAPLVNPAGPTTSSSPRTHALLVRLLNMPALVTGSPTAGPGTAEFGVPVLLPLGGRGVRSIDRNTHGQYLITAGPMDAVSNPPAAPRNFRLFTWTGYSAGAPIERSTTFDAAYSPEGCILPDEYLTEATVAEFVSDDGGGNGCWRSMTCAVGASAPPTAVPAPVAGAGAARFSRPPTPNPSRDGVMFAVQVSHAECVEVDVEDVAGRRVATLWRGELGAGEHPFAWNGVATGQARAHAALYWARVRTIDGVQTRAFALTP